MGEDTREVDTRPAVHTSVEGVDSASHVGDSVEGSVVVEEGMSGLQQQLRDLQVRRH